MAVNISLITFTLTSITTIEFVRNSPRKVDISIQNVTISMRKVAIENVVCLHTKKNLEIAIFTSEFVCICEHGTNVKLNGLLISIVDAIQQRNDVIDVRFFR